LTNQPGRMVIYLLNLYSNHNIRHYLIKKKLKTITIKKSALSNVEWECSRTESRSGDVSAPSCQSNYTISHLEHSGISVRTRNWKPTL